MSEDSKKEQMEQDVKSALQYVKGPALSAPVSTEEWERIVEAGDRSPEEKEKLKLLGRFLSLKQYFEGRGELLEPAIIDSYLELHNFSLPMQIRWLSNLNSKLMERMNAGSRA